MREKCIAQNIQVNGSAIAAFRPSQVPPTASSLPPLESRTRYWAISLSSSVNHLVFSGQSGRTKNATNPTRIETPPSMMKNHCQLYMPAMPPIWCKIPAAKKPEMMLEMVLPACQMAILMGFSALVYHELVIRVMPGKNGASQSPVMNRTTQKPAPDVTAGIQIVQMLQPIIIPGRSRLGRTLASHRFPGSWPTR
jgi:hypothetical protein